MPKLRRCLLLEILNRKSFYLTVLTFVFGIVFTVLPPIAKVTAQNQSGKQIRPDFQTRSCPTCSQPEQRTIYAPTIGLLETENSDIVLNCRSPHIMEAVPTFYTADGEAIVGETIYLQPAEVRFVSVESLIPAAERGHHIWGGISISYGGVIREVWAQITLHGRNQHASSDVTFSVLDNKGSATQEAIWWMPKIGKAVIALGNSSNSPIQTQMQFSDGSVKEVTIAPFATQYIRRNSLQSGAQSVRLTTTGPAGSLKTAGYVISSSNGSFTSSIRFYDTLNTAQPHLFATNFRVRNSYTHLLLKNTSAANVTAEPNFYPIESNGSTVSLPAITLAPGEIKEVDLQTFQTATKSRNDLDAVSVKIQNSGAPGSLIGALYSTNQTTGVVYDVPLRDSGPLSNSTGAYPWRLDDDYSSIITITNVSEEDAKVGVVIRYTGGQYMTARELKAGQTARFNLRTMRDQAVPDQDGKLIPANITNGQFTWSLLKSETKAKNGARLIGRSEVISKSRGESRSYSCITCCPNEGPFADDFLDFEAFVYYYSLFSVYGDWFDCYHNLNAHQPINFYSLSVQDASIASFNTYYSDGVRLNGLSSGDTTWSGDFYSTRYDPYVGDSACDDNNFFDSTNGNVLVKPTVTNVTTTDATKITQILGDSAIIHFVTPKGAANSQATLTATLSQNNQQILNNITWEGATKSASNPLIATLAKDTASKNVVKIKYKGNTIKELRVWVVWATISGGVATPTTIPVVINGRRQGTKVAADFSSTATIQPSSIITDSNRPDLSGSNTNPPPGGTNVSGQPLSGGANMKWDMSRRIKILANTLNPAINPPFLTDTTDNFPSDLVIGNDDAGVGDEVNDPYFNAGEIASSDQPSRTLLLQAGNIGDNYRSQLWFQEFARLEIQGTWYVVSDPLLWRVDFKMHKEAVTEMLWNVDTNGDGDLNDIVTEADLGIDTNGDGDLNDNVGYWNNDGSVSANDNAGA